MDSKKSSDIRRKPRFFKNNVIAANITNNNFPDIKKLVAENIRETNLLTYSFPCQGLSIANMGRANGIKPSTDSTSNLIWEIKRLLDDAKSKDEKLPKYLLMENVKSLISKKHIADYDSWKKYLKLIGYETYDIVLNGLYHRSIQKRKRLIGLSILKPSKKVNNLLREQRFKNIMKSKKYSKELSLKQRKIEYMKIFNSSSEKEIIESIPNNTKSRIRMAKDNIDLLDEAEKREYTLNTLTTKQDRHPNIGMIKHSLNLNGKCDKRFITTREAYQIMGFTNEDFNKVLIKYNENILTKASLYRQAGNSIVVTILEDVFNLIHDIDRGKYV